MKKIYLIDWNNFIYRMFFALPEFSTKDWIIVNALFWIAKFFVWQLIKENPDYLIFIKDSKWENFRHKIYSEYKATRDKMPDNLRSQIILIEDMIIKMWFQIIEIANYEADDVIWTLAIILWQDKWNDIYILSSDKDLYSLCQTNIKIYDLMKSKIYDYELAKNKFNIKPEYIIDYLSIVWDSSDNIPWIKWFWHKKAVDLINTYWCIEEIFNHINDDNFILKWKILEKLNNWKEMVFLSKKLATIKKDIEINNFCLEDFKFNKEKILNDEIKKLFQKYEFKSLYNEEKKLKTWNDLNLQVQIITNNSSLENLKSKIKNYKKIFFNVETTSLNIFDAKLVWISIYLDDKNIFYINHLHKWEQVETNNLKDFINYLLSLDVEIIWHNLKYDLEIIENFLNTKIWQKSQVKNNKDYWQISLNL